MSTGKTRQRPVGQPSSRAVDASPSSGERAGVKGDSKFKVESSKFKVPIPAALCVGRPDFASLKFDPSRTVLYVFEIARKLAVTETHVTDLIEEGKLRAINIGGKGTSGRRFYRIPVEAWNAYLEANTL